MNVAEGAVENAGIGMITVMMVGGASADRLGGTKITAPQGAAGSIGTDQAQLDYGKRGDTNRKAKYWLQNRMSKLLI